MLIKKLYAEDGAGGGAANGNEITVDKIPDTIKQELINQGFKTGFGKGKEKSEIEHKKYIESLGISEDKINEWKELEKQAEENKNKKAMEKGEFEKVLNEIKSKHTENLTTLEKKMSEKDNKLKELIIDHQIRNYAEKNNAINSAQVVDLLSKNITLNSNDEPEIISKNGNRVIDSNGDFITIEKYVIGFLNENPHLVRSSGAAGTGLNHDNKNSNGKRIYTPDEIKNFKYYTENKDDIDRAYLEGRIK